MTQVWKKMHISKRSQVSKEGKWQHKVQHLFDVLWCSRWECVVDKAEHLWNQRAEGGLKVVCFSQPKSGWFDSVTFADSFNTSFLPFIRWQPGQPVYRVCHNSSQGEPRDICMPSQELNTPLPALRCGFLWTTQALLARNTWWVEKQEEHKV